jgi:hypothetical protein
VESDESEEEGDSVVDEFIDEDLAVKEHEAYLTMYDAKARANEARKGRQVDTEEIKRKHAERLKAAKARSYCSVCKQPGHWHRDPECPENQKSTGKGAEVQTGYVTWTVDYDPSTINDIYYTDYMIDKKIPGITDCACSRTVMGIGIFNAMVEYYNKKGMKYKIVEEEEHYRFGAGKEFVSHRAIIGLAALKGIPFVI